MSENQFLQMFILLLSLLVNQLVFTDVTKFLQSTKQRTQSLWIAVLRMTTWSQSIHSHSLPLQLYQLLRVEECVYVFIHQHFFEVRHWCWMGRPGSQSSNSSPRCSIRLRSALGALHAVTPEQQGAIPKLFPQSGEHGVVWTLLVCWSIRILAVCVVAVQYFPGTCWLHLRSLDVTIVSLEAAYCQVLIVRLPNLWEMISALTSPLADWHFLSLDTEVANEEENAAVRTTGAPQPRCYRRRLHQRKSPGRRERILYLKVFKVILLAVSSCLHISLPRVPRYNRWWILDCDLWV